MTFAIENHLSRVDESTAAIVQNHGTELTLAFDKELVPNFVVAALNLTYRPEWTRLLGVGDAEQESTIGAGVALMARVLRASFSAVRRATCENIKALDWMSSRAKRCLWARPRISNSRKAPADGHVESAGVRGFAPIEFRPRPRGFRTPSSTVGIRR
jgi:hypothetical protein